MATKNKLGIFLDINTVSAVEIQRKKLLNFFDAPHSLFDNAQMASAQNIPDEIKLIAIIQKSLRDNKIETSDVSLALPTQDVILRSFSVPWVTSSELKGVIDFEARRYIPFKLEELVYSYHTITEKRNQRIRVLFVAVRKEMLEKYCSILTQAGLQITHAEPASLGLLRLLSFTKYIQHQKEYAIVQVVNSSGTIMIINKGLPQFLRDFKIMPSIDITDVDSNDFPDRLVNEVRISLDYYRRQHTQCNIDKILFISENNANDHARALEKDLGVETTLITAQEILKTEKEVTVGTLNAFGVGLQYSIPSPVKIDLMKPHIKLTETKMPPKEVPINLIATLKISVVCVFSVILVFLFSGIKVSGYKKQLAGLSKKEGIYEALSISDLKTRQATELLKLEGYKNVRLKSGVSFFLSRIPYLLPEEAWLTNLNISYSNAGKFGRRRGRKQASKDTGKLKTNVSVQMDGYVYFEDQGQQVNLVNNFINNLRNDKEFTDTFEKIVLTSVNKQNFGKHIVTRFQIKCN